MSRRLFGCFLAPILFLASGLACGGNSRKFQGESQGGTAGDLGVAGVPANGGSSGSGGTSNAGSGGISAGTSGTGGSALADCTAPFGEPEPALITGADERTGSLSISYDELELFYVLEVGDNSTFMVSRRDDLTKPFPAGTPVPELDALCTPGHWKSVELTEDALRVYFSCGPIDALTPHTLYTGTRVDRNTPFVVSPQPLSLRAGPSLTISGDELLAMTIGVPWDDPGVLLERTARTLPFGDPLSIPGLESVALSTPELSSDGLHLFALVENDFVRFDRPNRNAGFGAPVTVLEPSEAGEVIGSPSVTPDCRALYYVRAIRGKYDVEVARQ